MRKLPLRIAALVLFCVAATTALPAQTFTKIADFDGTNGAGPEYMSLVQGADGNLYGTTTGGGSNVNTEGGTVFRVNRAGKLTTIYSFCSEANCADGYQPNAGVVLGPNGDFYGTTRLGGSGANCPYVAACGTVFKISRGGRFTQLHNFCSNPGCTDGWQPAAPLFLATNGGLYGTTLAGGSDSACSGSGCGSVFKISTGGVLTTLHDFNFDVDGQNPYGGLIEGTDGNLYGTTYAGGADEPFDGSVYKMTPEGQLTTLLTFDILDGGEAYSGLIQATDGYFYGTTLFYDVIYRINSEGIETVAYEFNNYTFGYYPYAGVIQATDGNFYGTTLSGGDLSCQPPYGCGTIFELTPSGELTTLHAFEMADGANPYGGLVQATDGNFYGSTTGGGADNNGTLFRLSTGLGPFVSFVLPAGKVGQASGILGQAFIGTTSVTLNGIPMSFTVVSDTLIKATVPDGATTGLVTVTTPTGTLTSNVPFHVIP